MPNFVDYANPKPLSAPLTEREAKFVEGLVHLDLSPEDAFVAAGFSSMATFRKRKSSPRTSPAMGKDGKPLNCRIRALRLQRYLWQHIEALIKQRVGETARQALAVMEHLLIHAESENVRLNAARDLLSRAGYDATQRQETTIKDISSLTDKEIDDQLTNMLKPKLSSAANVVSINKRNSKKVLSEAS